MFLGVYVWGWQKGRVKEREERSEKLTYPIPIILKQLHAGNPPLMDPKFAVWVTHYS